MQNKLLKKAEKYAKQYRRRRVIRRIVSIMACVVVFCTTYALIIPALTMERESICGLEEHAHSEGCYSQVTSMEQVRLDCSYDSLEVHKHTAECRGAEGNITCGMADFLVHKHDTSCYNAEGYFVCALPEIKEHEHTEECYAPVEIEVHTHGEDCYTVQLGELACGMEEVEGHAHAAECYTRGELVCEVEESEGHTHGEGCSETVQVCEATMDPHTHDEGCYVQLVCELPEDETHTHSDECNGLVLSCNLTEVPHTHVDGCWQTVQKCELPESEGHAHGDACYEALLICETEESEGHAHEDACHEQISELICEIEEGTPVETAEPAPEPELICEKEEIKLHDHKDACYEISQDAEGNEVRTLICEETVVLEHKHGESCLVTEEVPVDMESLTCTQEAAHVHSETCYDEAEVLLCTESTEGHVHGTLCYGTWVRTCQLEEHAHNEACYPEPAATYYCGLEEHSHSEECSDEEGNLTCTLPEHAHVEECTWELSEEERAKIAEVEALIEPLPGYDEIMAKLDEFYEADDTEGEEAYLTEVYAQVEEAYRAYMALDESLRGYVANADKLMELEFIWSRFTLEEPVETDTAGETVYYCGQEAHSHTADCRDVYDNLICTQEEHTHTADCEVAPVYYCGKEAHAHDESCGETCELEEHTHDAQCEIAPVYYCGLEKDPSHVHEDSCLISPYKCGLEQHLHDEDCPEDCAVIEHVHTDICKEEPTYQCGLEEHQHSDACYDADGNLICELDEHTHTEDCLQIYYCGIVYEHVHSGCYVNFVHTCNKIGHEHFYLCTVKPQYCAEEHIHNAQCYDEEGILTCTEHTHILSCWINPASSGTNTDPEGTFAGSNRFHSSHFLKYQASGHTVSSYEIGTFVLIPESANVDGWVPNTRVWTGDSNANYLVAYCSDDRTSSSKKGEGYETYTLDTSRFTNDEQRRKVAAIIGHSYPFLSTAEMREQLQYAYDQGLTVDNNGNLIDIRDSVESDWIGATQWALWDTTTTMEHHPTNEVDIDDYGRARPSEFPSQSERYCINPLTNPGYTDIATSRLKLEAIHNWLMNLQEPEALTVKEYTYEITENEDGTYKLTVDVTLNRETVFGEHTVFQLSVGEKATAINEMDVGTGSFQLILDGIMLEEIANARVHLNVDGKHMQAYFFDSFNYQDMIGGNWEYYSEDLSFDVAADLTDVTVYKKWAEGAPADIESVTVQLYADGKPYGESVQLSEANGWTYTWKDLNKCHISGTKEDGTVFGGDEIVYTIVESPVPGYYSSLTQVEGFNGEVEEEAPVTITYWKEVDTFTGEGEYVLLSDVGALTASYFKDKYYMNVSPIDLSVVTESQADSVWVATGDDSTGYKLASKKYPSAYMGYEELDSEAYADRYFVKNGLLSSGGFYFCSFYSNGYQVYTRDPDRAMHFRLYKLTTETLEGSEINFLLTNSKIPEEAFASVTVTKKWEGRRDSNYPLSASVTLMQDGRPYGDPVKLNAANDWTYTWNNLPYSMNGKQVTYSVKETPVPGYEAGYEVQDNMNTDDRALILTLTNTWKPAMVPLEVRKADVDKPAVLLPGAQFDVYVVDTAAEDRINIPGTDYSGLLLDQLTVPENGMVYEFESGEVYCLVETVAPDGYNMLADPIVLKVTEKNIFVLSGDDWTLTEDGILTITNKAGYELPETGGMGTTAFYMFGGMMLLAAVVLLDSKKRRAAAL